MIISASLDALYGSTVVAVRMESSEPFAVEMTGTILRATAGRLGVGRQVVSEESAPGRHVAEVEALDWVIERAVEREDAQGPQHRYGISFYPFVSSFLRGQLQISHGGDQLPMQFVVDTPDGCRLLYAQAQVRFDGSTASEPRHTQAADRSRFIFGAGAAPRTVDCDVAMRFSAAHLAELVTYPTAYYVLSLGGIGVAAVAGRLSILITAVGALWTFMLREWSKAAVPRRQTLLSAAYVSAAVLAGAWAALWEGVGWWAGLSIPVVAVLVGTLVAARRTFDGTTGLPRPHLALARRPVTPVVPVDIVRADGGSGSTTGVCRTRVRTGVSKPVRCRVSR